MPRSPSATILRRMNPDGQRLPLLARDAIRLVSGHPSVRHVELAGSRSRGTHDELSDWDFAVTTSDFAALARDRPALMAPLHPLGRQWEPLGHFPVYQVLLPGPTKVECLFLDQSQEATPPPQPGPLTEPPANIEAAIDAFVTRRDELEREYGLD